MIVMLFMYLCDVASVSQLCTFPLLSIYMGCCEDYLTCDIAFNAVMPLSRASTRRRYSRIEGVTVTSPLVAHAAASLPSIVQGSALTFIKFLSINKSMYWPSQNQNEHPSSYTKD